MKMQELLSALPPDINLKEYRRLTRPPLDASKLSMQAYIGPDRHSLRTPVEGDASLVIRYQGYEGAITSLAELTNGEVWNVLQVQGAKSKKSYRVNSGLNWRQSFAAQIRTYAEHPESDVRQLWMPPAYRVTNLTDAANFEGARSSYSLVAASLGLRWSDENDAFIADITKSTNAKSLQFLQKNGI